MSLEGQYVKEDEMSDNKELTNLEKIMGLEVNPQSLKEKFLIATFEIIAESGADALSANELIKKTNSSKGALFHHFKTLDDLCLDSLRYFRENSKPTLANASYANVKDFLRAFVQDAYTRQCNKGYFHIVHFFRDRALKDERFRVALDALSETYLNAATDLTLKYLPSTADAAQVRELVVFVFLTLERMCYRRVTNAGNAEMENTISWFIGMVEQKLSSLGNV